MDTASVSFCSFSSSFSFVSKYLSNSAASRCYSGHTRIIRYRNYLQSAAFFLKRRREIRVYYIFFSFDIFFIFALLFVLSVFWTVLTKKNLDKFTNVVNVIAAVLVAISIINIGMYELRHGRTARSIENTTVYESDGKFKNQGALPNIYYIILDGYAAADTLSEIYSYDNSEFLAFLADRGFFVPSKSRSNYAWTHLSLASSLNMEHITFLTDTLGIDSLDRTTPFQMIEDNAVQEFLKANDYKFIHVSSGLARMTNKNRNAEVNFKAGRLDEFSLLLLETTALYPFMKGAVGVDARNTVLYAFDVL